MKLSETMGLVSHFLKSRDTEKEELRSLISVTEPYFALSNFRLEDEFLTADIPLELEEHDEPTGMSLAEAGRHIAILGSLAAADANPVKEKHYYLATHAILERCHNRTVEAGTYKGSVKLESLNKRKASIEGVLYSPSGEEFYKARIDYVIMNSTVFERMFEINYNPFIKQTVYNPYEIETALFDTEIGLKSSKASMGIIIPEDCIGHFDNFPAIPVARLGGALTRLSGLQHNYICNNDKQFCIKKAEIDARSFVFAGKEVFLNSEVISSDDNDGLFIESYASTDDCKRAAVLKLWYY